MSRFLSVRFGKVFGLLFIDLILSFREDSSLVLKFLLEVG
jgi:hypothetical protein